MTMLAPARVDTPIFGDDAHGRLTDVAQTALAAARAQGMIAAEAGAHLSQGLAVTGRLGEVETLEHTRDKGLSVTVYFGNRPGSASTTDLSPAAVQEAVRAACTIARYTAQDECAGLADPDRLARGFSAPCLLPPPQPPPPPPHPT